MVAFWLDTMETIAIPICALCFVLCAYILRLTILGFVSILIAIE